MATLATTHVNPSHFLSRQLAKLTRFYDATSPTKNKLRVKTANILSPIGRRSPIRSAPYCTSITRRRVSRICITSQVHIFQIWAPGNPLLMSKFFTCKRKKASGLVGAPHAVTQTNQEYTWQKPQACGHLCWNRLCCEERTYVWTIHLIETTLHNTRTSNNVVVRAEDG